MQPPVARIFENSFPAMRPHSGASPDPQLRLSRQFRKLGAAPYPRCCDALRRTGPAQSSRYRPRHILRSRRPVRLPAAGPQEGTSQSAVRPGSILRPSPFPFATGRNIPAAPGTGLQFLAARNAAATPGRSLRPQAERIVLACPAVSREPPRNNDRRPGESSEASIRGRKSLASTAHHQVQV